jgi:hypothetical protein
MVRVDLCYTRARGNVVNEDSYHETISLVRLNKDACDWENCKTPEDVGRKVARSLYFWLEGPVSAPVEDEVYIYLSLDKNVIDERGNIIKPYLHATRERVMAFGITSDNDDLSRIHRSCLEMLTQLKNKK